MSDLVIQNTKTGEVFKLVDADGKALTDAEVKALLEKDANLELVDLQAIAKDPSLAATFMNVQGARADELLGAINLQLTAVETANKQLEIANEMNSLLQQMGMLVPAGADPTQNFYSLLTVADKATYTKLETQIKALAAENKMTVPKYAKPQELQDSIATGKTMVDNLTQTNQLEMVRMQSLKDKMMLCYEMISAILSAQKDMNRSIANKW